MDVQAVFLMTAIPTIVGLGFAVYGCATPMMWEDARPRTLLTTPRFYWSLLLAGFSLTLVLAASVDFHYASHSQKLGFSAEVTHLRRQQVRHGDEMYLDLHADDGTSHSLAMYDVKDLKVGDRIRVTILAYNNDVLEMTAFTGALHAHPIHAMSVPGNSPVLIMYGGMSGLLALGIGTGFIQKRLKRAAAKEPEGQHLT